MGSSAPATAAQPALQTRPQPQAASADEVRAAVLNALSTANQAMLCAMLESGEWKIEGNELVIRVAASSTLIDMSVSSEAKKIIMATASGTLARAVKLQILPGAAPAQPGSKVSTPISSGGSRGRAEQEPVVQRLKEKFGAEIRTVIDYKVKK